MSIIVASVTPDRVAVVTDSLTYTARQPAGLTWGKAGCAGRILWAHRGAVWLADHDDAWLRRLAAEAPVEAIVDGLARVARPETSASDEPGRCPYELLIAGWSESAGRMLATMLRWEGGRPTVTPLADHVHVWPGNLGADATARLARQRDATADQLVAVAMGLWRIPRAFDLPYCVGGVAHLTEADRDGAGQRIAALFPDYDDLAARFGDPNADAVAAWRGAQPAAQRVAA